MSTKKQNTTDAKIYKMYHSGNYLQIQEAKDLAVSKYADFIHHIIHRNFSSFQKDHEELFHAGVVGLLIALGRYDGKHAFTTCSQVYIIHEIAAFTHYRTQTGSAYDVRVLRKMKLAENSLIAAGESVSLEKLSEISGLSTKVIKNGQKLQAARNTCQLDDSIPDLFSVEDVIDQTFARQLLAHAMDVSNLHYLVLYYRICEEYTFPDIERKLNIREGKAYEFYREVIYYLQSYAAMTS